MRVTILNRQFQHPADGWYQIETPGEHPNRKAGVVQTIDGVAVASLVATFNREADAYQQKYGVVFPGMLIDHEHFKHDSDKETRAYGWLMRLENRNGIPFGQINWTATGKPAVDGGDYRFFSTEYDPADLQVINRGQTPPHMRPLRLAGLTLTNDPNNKGGAPITNRNTEMTYDGGCVATLFPMPDLDRWFQAVKAIQDSAEKHTSVALDFSTCWDLCKKQFPDLYSAAFGAAENSDTTDATDAETKIAADQVSMLANRIKAVSGNDFTFGWEFTRRALPAVFNRMRAAGSRNSIANRATPAQVEADKAARQAGDQAAAAARGYQAQTGCTFDEAWNHVRYSRPELFNRMCR